MQNLSLLADMVSRKQRYCAIKPILLQLEAENRLGFV